MASKDTVSCDDCTLSSVPKKDAALDGVHDKCSSDMKADQSYSNASQYELVDGRYYYTDSEKQRYKFDSVSNKWVIVDKDEVSDDDKATFDEEGRCYYSTDGFHFCQDPAGNVYYLNDKCEWESCSSSTVSQPRWYFYQDKKMCYRDNNLGAVFMFNEDKNEWEKCEDKAKKRALNSEEEFDSDEELDDEDSTVPIGYPDDPNIKLEEGKYVKLNPDDGTEYEWSSKTKAWFPKLNDEFLANYQLSYGFNECSASEKASQPSPDEDTKVYTVKEDEVQPVKSRDQKKPSWFQMSDAHNTKVYVSNLPDDMSEEEFVDVMQKCGLVLKDPDSHKFKVKLYRDAEGNFKGDALCTYIKVESVDLALQILDGSFIKGKSMKVERAQFEMKGEYNPALRPKKKKKKVIEGIKKKQAKLFEWRPDEEEKHRGKNESVIIIRNVFDPQELGRAPDKIFHHKTCVKNLCSTFGMVKKLELYENHPEGIVKVFFDDPDIADFCKTNLHQRLYDQRIISVSTWDGKEKFLKLETEEERAKRLEKWAEFIEDAE